MTVSCSLQNRVLWYFRGIVVEVKNIDITVTPVGHEKRFNKAIKRRRRYASDTITLQLLVSTIERHRIM